jgi:hypothetical protein
MSYFFMSTTIDQNLDSKKKEGVFCNFANKTIKIYSCQSISGLLWMAMGVGHKKGTCRDIWAILVAQKIFGRSRDIVVRLG